MAFTSEVLAQRTSTGERRTVKEQGSLGSPHVNTVGSLIHIVYSLSEFTRALWQSTDVMCM
jgi:hypothetical protein